MAEAIARARFAGKDGDLFFISAGIAAAEGAPASTQALATLSSRGITHRGQARQLTSEMAMGADLVLCMTGGHLMAVEAMLGDQADDVMLALLDPQGDDIGDPIGGSEQLYAAVADAMEPMIDHWINQDSF